MVSLNDKDEQLLVEHGFYKRTAKEEANSLQQNIPKGRYDQQQPVTFYTEGLEKKHYYMTAGTGVNPFAKTHGFTQPVQLTRAVNAYEGNVDFQREGKNVSFYKTQNDYRLNNPHKEKPVQIANFEEIRSRVVEFCKQRSSNGLRGLRQMFRAMDRNRNGSLDPVEFKYAMRDYGVQMSEQECQAIVKYFDTNRDGKISFDEFLRAIRGELNDFRRGLVR